MKLIIALVKKYLQEGTTIIFLLILFIQIQACQKKGINNSLGKQELPADILQMDKNIENKDTISKNIHGHLNIKNVTILCPPSSWPTKRIVIKIKDAQTRVATIQYENEINTQLQLPPAFCDTLTKSLYRFYVKGDPIILSQSKSVIEVSYPDGMNPTLKVVFLYNDHVYKNETIVFDKFGYDRTRFSIGFVKFRNWLERLAHQFEYNPKDLEKIQW